MAGSIQWVAAAACCCLHSMQCKALTLQVGRWGFATPWAVASVRGLHAGWLAEMLRCGRYGADYLLVIGWAVFSSNLAGWLCVYKLSGCPAGLGCLGVNNYAGCALHPTCPFASGC